MTAFFMLFVTRQVLETCLVTLYRFNEKCALNSLISPFSV